MSHFLFKPHIEGPKGLITTPDVIIDRLFVSVDSDLTPTSTSLLTSVYSQQSSKSERVAPLYALTSLGAGIIISPGATLSNGPINIARKGWRLNNLAGHTEGIMLNDTALTDLSTPEILIKIGFRDMLKLKLPTDPRWVNLAKIGYVHHEIPQD